MTVAAPAVLKCVASMTYPGGWLCQNVFYWYLPPGSDAQAESDILSNVSGKLEDMYGELVGRVSEDFTFDDVKVDVVEWDETEEIWVTSQTVGTTNISVTPTATDDPLPPYVSAFITAFTSKVRTRGRKQIAGLTEAAQNLGVPGSLTLTYLASFAAEWLVDIVMPDINELQPVIINSIGEVCNIIEMVVGDVMGTTNSRKFRNGV